MRGASEISTKRILAWKKASCKANLDLLSNEFFCFNGDYSVQGGEVRKKEGRNFFAHLLVFKKSK